MALIPSGFGWSADENYMLQSSGKFAEINGLTGLPELPVAETDADVVGNGILCYERDYTTSSGHRQQYRFYAAATESGCIVGLAQGSTTNSITAYSASSNARLRVVQLGSRDGGSWTVSGSFDSQIDNSSGISGVFTTAQAFAGSSGITIYIPSGTATEIKEMVTRLESDILKTNSGYAVACVVKYKNNVGDIITTPYLISSKASLTMMDGMSTYTEYLSTELRDGVRFYYRLYTDGEKVTPYSVLNVDLTSEGRKTIAEVFQRVYTIASITVTDVADPYDPDGSTPSEPGGGDSGTVPDDLVGIIHNPFIPSALGTGLVRAFCPTEADLNNLRNWLWDAPGQGGLDLDDLKRIFVDPADNIVGLSVVPISITGPSVNFSFGGVVPSFTLPQLQHQYYQVQCGYINVEKRWGSYLDYEPYTEFYIYLPFIGMKPISADEIMGKQLIVDYDIDVISGACLARVQAGQHLLYSWSGQCAMQIPINARNWDSVFATAIQCATQVATGIATGGSSLLGGAAASSVNALTTKARIQHSGVLSSAPGWMGNLTPYIVRVNPVLAIPEDQNKFIGYPSWTSVNLGSLTGFNIISSIHLEGVPATDNELTEIEEILKEGVIF